MNMEGIDSKKIQFFKEKIKNRLTELRPYMSDVKYRMYMSVIGDCKDLDELREMAEMDLQFNMVKYLNELTDKIKLSDTSIDELEAVINQNTRAAKLTVIVPKKKEKTTTYEEVVENIDEVLEDKDVLEASANILWQRLNNPTPSDVDISDADSEDDDDIEIDSISEDIYEIDEYDDAALEEAYGEDDDEEAEDTLEIDEIDEYDDAALEELYEEEEYLDGLDDIDDIDELDEDEDNEEDEQDEEDETELNDEEKPIDFGGNNEAEEEPIDFGVDTTEDTEQNTSNNNPDDEFGLDSLGLDDMYSLGEDEDDEDENDDVINIDDLFGDDDQAYDEDDDYALDEDEDEDEDEEDDELNIDDMYGDEDEEDDDTEEDEEDDELELDEMYGDEDDSEDDEEDNKEEDDFESLDPDDMFGDDEPEEEDEDEQESESDELNPDDMYGDNEDDDQFDIDESELTGDVDNTDSDLNTLFENTSTTENKAIPPQKRVKTQDKVFINGTQRGKQTQDMFNMIFGIAGKVSKLKNTRR